MNERSSVWSWLRVDCQQHWKNARLRVCSSRSTVRTPVVIDVINQKYEQTKQIGHIEHKNKDVHLIIQSNTVMESVFDFLHYEIVKYSLNDSDGNEKSDKSTKLENLSTLEYIGYSTGYRLTERMTREWPRYRFKDDLETMKFICTDFWTSIYKKQIDNLRTNHKGVYVLQDNAFRFLANLSNSTQYLEEAPKFIAYTCGLVRGSLANLGIKSTVTAEVQAMPTCRFHIQVHSNFWHCWKPIEDRHLIFSNGNVLWYVFCYYAYA